MSRQKLRRIQHEPYMQEHSSATLVSIDIPLRNADTSLHELKIDRWFSCTDHNIQLKVYLIIVI